LDVPRALNIKRRKPHAGGGAGEALDARRGIEDVASSPPIHFAQFLRKLFRICRLVRS
jgi:hypothetical protein